MAEIGDLICYNCAGQLKKTLGLVLNKVLVKAKHSTRQHPDSFAYRGGWVLQVQWLQRGERLPRDVWPDFHNDEICTRDSDDKWYHDKDYFSVVKN
jgi:hypothetical protein